LSEFQVFDELVPIHPAFFPPALPRSGGLRRQQLLNPIEDR
jgi:hypothetical protein